MNASTEPRYTLLGIRFSHYVEKVRWTLDWLEVPYREIPLLPVTHFAYVARHVGLRGAGDRHSTRFSTPVLLETGGIAVQKSSVIMRRLNERHGGGDRDLFPSEEAASLDEYYNDFLGPSVRRIFYHHALAHAEILREIASRNVGPAQARAFCAIFPLVKGILTRAFDVSGAELEKRTGYLFKEFEEAGKRLSDGRPFFLGDRFTVADISFACLGGIAMLPSPQEGFGAWLPPEGGPSEGLRRISRALRESDAGKWVLRLYREHRGRRVIPCEPAVR